MKKILTVLFAILPLFAFTQGFRCNYDGKNMPVISKEKIEKFITSHGNLRVAGTVTLPVQVHIVKTSANVQVNEADVTASFDKLNQVFLPMGIQFAFCNGFHYIDDDYWSTLYFIQEINLGWTFNAPGTIDVFYTQNVPGAAGEFISFTDDKDGYIAIQNDYANGNVLVHEMGHYFSLVHTHDDTYGKEYVDGTNCNTAGDGLCDTPADPDLTGKVDNSCVYIGTDLDPKGQAYHPDTKNYMSYSNQSCYASFSPEQSDRISYFLSNQIMTNMDYRCAALPDFFGKIDDNVTALNREVANTVQVIFINFSNVPSSIKNLDYSIVLRDVSGTATSLGKFTKAVNGAAFGRDTFELQVTPPNLPDGIYTLEVSLDPDNKISEISEINNVAIQRVAIYQEGQAYPDWQMTATGASTVCQGCEYVLNYTLKNIGNNDAAQSSLRFYISEDDQMDDQDIVLGPYYYSSTPPDSSWNSDQYLLIPPVLNKTFYVFAAIDLDNQIRELRKDNNVAMVKVTVTGPSSGGLMADYVINDPEYPTTTVFEAGDPVALSAKFDDIGSLSVSNVAVGLYYSQDNILDANDALIYKSISRMYGNTTNKSFISGYIPWTASPGTAYIILKADYPDFVPESNEKNNTIEFPITIQNPTKPHLFITSGALSNYQWTDQGTYQFTATLTNSGVSPAYETSITIYLTNRLLFNQLSFTGTYAPFNKVSAPASINPNGSESTVYTGPVDAGYIAPGTYDVEACLQYQDNNMNWVYGACYLLNEQVTYTQNPVLAVTDKAGSAGESIVYPVPAAGDIYIQNNSEILDATLFSLNGQKVNEAIFLKTANQVRLNGTVSGMYFLKITTTKGTEMKKVVIK